MLRLVRYVIPTFLNTASLSDMSRIGCPRWWPVRRQYGLTWERHMVLRIPQCGIIDGRSFIWLVRSCLRMKVVILGA